MRTRISLTTQSINQTIAELQNYRNNILPNRITQFLDKLASIGVTVAIDKSQGDSHHFDQMVSFTKVFDTNTHIVVIGYNDNLRGLHIHWYDGQGKPHDETISPIMALEYGTAGLAIKGHQGTAVVTGNHVNDTQWYYYEEIDENGKPIKPHYATAEEAHQPMYHAAEQMVKDIVRVAREVWEY